MFPKTMYWYQVIEANVPKYKLGMVFGVEHPNEDLACWGYKDGKFYPEAKLRKIGMTKKGSSKENVRKWIDKKVAELSQGANDSTGEE